MCGFLLFYNFSSYLVQSRRHALSEQARFLAQSTALEIQRAGGRDVAGILARRQAAASTELPSASIAVVPVARICGEPAPAATVLQNSDFRLQISGPWSHVDPPKTIPAWINCPGFAGVLAYSHRRTVGGPDDDTHLLVRGVAFPDAPRSGYAVVVDLLVTDAIRLQLKNETGVEIKSVPPRRRARPGTRGPRA